VRHYQDPQDLVVHSTGLAQALDRVVQQTTQGNDCSDAIGSGQGAGECDVWQNHGAGASQSEHPVNCRREQAPQGGEQILVSSKRNSQHGSRGTNQGQTQ